MKGVMIPGVSAGSNQVGAREIGAPQVSCPAGSAAGANPGAPVATRPSALAASSSRRVILSHRRVGVRHALMSPAPLSAPLWWACRHCRATGRRWLNDSSKVYQRRDLITIDYHLTHTVIFNRLVDMGGRRERRSSNTSGLQEVRFWPLRALPILGLWKFAVKVRNRASHPESVSSTEGPFHTLRQNAITS